MVSDARQRLGTPLVNAENSLEAATTLEDYLALQETLATLTAQRPNAATFYGRTPERLLDLVSEGIKQANAFGGIEQVSAEDIEATHDDTVQHVDIAPTNPIESLLVEVIDKLWQDVRATET